MPHSPSMCCSLGQPFTPGATQVSRRQGWQVRGFSELFPPCLFRSSCPGRGVPGAGSPLLHFWMGSTMLENTLHMRTSPRGVPQCLQVPAHAVPCRATWPGLSASSWPVVAGITFPSASSGSKCQTCWKQWSLRTLSSPGCWDVAGHTGSLGTRPSHTPWCVEALGLASFPPQRAALWLRPGLLSCPWQGCSKPVLPVLPQVGTGQISPTPSSQGPSSSGRKGPPEVRSTIQVSAAAMAPYRLCPCPGT